MNHHIRILIAIALTVVGMAVTSPHAIAQEFENQKQAGRFINELNSFRETGNAEFFPPIANLDNLMKREFSTYRQAVNSSETMEEAESKYQVNLQDFKDARAQFDQAIIAAQELRDTSQFPEIQALADQYVMGLKNSQNRINHIAVALKYHDHKALLAEKRGLQNDVDAVSNYWKAEMPTLKAKYIAAKANFKRVYEPPVTDCPYEEGTKPYVLHCILGQPMSEGTGN